MRTPGLRRALTILAASALLVGQPLLTSIPANAADAPALASPDVSAKGPVGWDSYRQLDRLPALTTGVQSVQFSSADRGGANGDFNNTLSQAPDGFVLAEHAGPGELSSIWFTSNSGDVTATGKVRITLDGTVVLDAPLQDVVNGKLGAPFVFPVVGNADQSSGGVYINAPMPFRHSMRVTTEANPSFYNIMTRTFADASGVSTFDPSDKALDVIATMTAAGKQDPKPARPNATTTTGDFALDPGKTAELGSATGPGAISALRIQLPQLFARTSAADALLQQVRLRMTFDGQRTVDAPIGEFFGSGQTASPVRSLMYAIDPAGKLLSSWWLMPYAQSARIELYNGSKQVITSGSAEVTSAADSTVAAGLGATGNLGYFRTTSNQEQTTVGEDYVFLQASGWGKFVGVTHTMSGPANRIYLEGDERAYVDGARTPQIHGSGTEDFYKGAWYFNRGTFTGPLNGNPVHLAGTTGCPTDCTVAYRVMLADAVPFHSSLTFGIEHGTRDETQSKYSSTAYWYGRDAGVQRITDTVDVGNISSEQSHQYTSANPGAVATLTSTYAGSDATPAPVTKNFRATSAPVSFALGVDPSNKGVQIRRMGDQQLPQSAQVYVDGQDAGTWVQPDHNTFNRWRDDFFLVPPALSAGKANITVRLVPTAGMAPFSAARYEALNFVASFVDTRTPSPVTGLAAKSDMNEQITVSWNTASDNVGVDHYAVYGSTDPSFTSSASTLLGTAKVPYFTHTQTGLLRTWFYRVVAVDAAGNTGAPSAMAGARSGFIPAELTVTSLGPTPSVADGVPQFLYATVSPGSSTGTVTFYDGDTELAGCVGRPVIFGYAVCITTFTSPGIHPLTASYGGDITHLSSAAHFELTTTVERSFVQIVLGLLTQFVVNLRIFSF